MTSRDIYVNIYTDKLFMEGFLQMKINDKTKSILIVLGVFVVLILYTYGVRYSTKKNILSEQAIILDDTYKKAYDCGYDAGYEDGKKTITAVLKSTETAKEATSDTSANENSSNLPTEISEDTVYITKSGSKYHKETCHTLRGNGTPINLEDAKNKGKDACKICFK